MSRNVRLLPFRLSLFVLFLVTESVFQGSNILPSQWNGTESPEIDPKVMPVFDSQKSGILKQWDKIIWVSDVG